MSIVVNFLRLFSLARFKRKICCCWCLNALVYPFCISFGKRAPIKRYLFVDSSYLIPCFALVEAAAAAAAASAPAPRRQHSSTIDRSLLNFQACVNDQTANNLAIWCAMARITGQPDAATRNDQSAFPSLFGLRSLIYNRNVGIACNGTTRSRCEEFMKTKNAK